MCFPTISQHKCDICRNLTKFLISRELQLRSAWDEHLREYKSPKLSRLLDTDAIRNKRMMITIFSKNHPHSDDDDRQTSVWLSLTMRVNWHKSHWSFLPPLICLTIHFLVDYYFLTHSISYIPLLSGKLEDHNHNSLTFAELPVLLGSHNVKVKMVMMPSIVTIIAATIIMEIIGTTCCIADGRFTGRAVDAGFGMSAEAAKRGREAATNMYPMMMMRPTLTLNLMMMTMVNIFYLGCTDI